MSTSTYLIIARHGNTFRSNELPRRVGRATDLPLVEQEKGHAIGRWLLRHGWAPDRVLSAPLLRTVQTARLAIEAMQLDLNISHDNRFSEIDYGPDENATEAAVWLRLGKIHHPNPQATDKELLPVGKRCVGLWNSHAIVPAGWNVQPESIKTTWEQFGKELTTKFRSKTTLLVTSNGIARFAPVLTGNFRKFTENHALKIGTGAICIFEKKENSLHWDCLCWNERPEVVS